MKLRLFLVPAACLSLLVFPSGSASSQTVVTFDDIPVDDNGHEITSPYSGLVWSNFGVLNAVQGYTHFGGDGYFYGLVTASNVACNEFGSPAEIDSPATNFDFQSAYLTGAWRSNLNIEVQGFSGATLLYDTTVVASATSPTLFTFNYLDIDRLYFNSFGGQFASFPTGGNGTQFVMDNFTFEFVPEPSSFLLTSLGVLSLWAFAKRKRT